MKVLLTRDVDRLGRAGTVKTVTNGYARNYLFPKGLAVPATESAMKQAEQIQKAAALRSERLIRDATALVERLAGVSLTFKARAGEEDKLYGSVTAGDIAEALSAKVGIEIDKRKIMLEEPIRDLGPHRVAIKLAGDLAPQVTVTVERED
jgi:large subunit ribosomal protein L9